MNLPTSVEAERFVLGSIMLTAEMFDNIRGAIDEDDFSLEKHRRIFRRMTDLNARGEVLDRVTVYHELDKHKEAQSCDGIGYLAELDNGLPQLPNIDAYVRIVREKAILRRTIFACQSMMDRCMSAKEGSEEILTAAESTLQKLAEQGATGAPSWRNPGEVMAQYPGGIGAFLDPQRHTDGILTPWAAFNSSTGGLRAGELCVIGGRPSMGKSLVSMQIALQAAQSGIGVAVFSLEMSAESLIYRLLSGLSQVDAHKFRMGYLSHDERKRINQAVGDIQDLPLKIDESRARTVPAITSALRKLVAQMPVSLIVIDHLQLMRTTGRAESARVGLSEICHSMKHIASDFGAAVVLCSQLNRDCEKENRRPQLSDLNETGSIEQDADVVAFIHRWERYQKFRGREDMRGDAELILAKQRNGPVGMVRLVFLDGQQKFESRADSEELQRGGDE